MGYKEKIIEMLSNIEDALLLEYIYELLLNW